MLNKVVGFEYGAMSTLTVTLVMLLKPLAGAALGIFVVMVFASGTVATPFGDATEEALPGISKGGALVFAIAFIAGLADDFALNVANRFALLVRGNRPERRERREV